MSDDSLNYQAPLGNRPTGMRTAAWISLVVLGILYILGGLCGAGSMMFVSAMVGGPGGPAVPANTKVIFLVIAIVLLVLSAGIGGVYIWTGFLVRRFSRAAAITSLIISAINALGFLAIVVLGTIGILMTPGRRNPGALVGVLFYIVPVFANAWVAIALTMVLRDKRG